MWQVAGLCVNYFPTRYQITRAAGFGGSRTLSASAQNARNKIEATTYTGSSVVSLIFSIGTSVLTFCTTSRLVK
jgi:hypothetical protein